MPGKRITPLNRAENRFNKYIKNDTTYKNMMAMYTPNDIFYVIRLRSGGYKVTSESGIINGKNSDYIVVNEFRFYFGVIPEDDDLDIIDVIIPGKPKRTWRRIPKQVSFGKRQSRIKSVISDINFLLTKLKKLI